MSKLTVRGHGQQKSGGHALHLVSTADLPRSTFIGDEGRVASNLFPGEQQNAIGRPTPRAQPCDRFEIVRGDDSRSRHDRLQRINSGRRR